MMIFDSHAHLDVPEFDADRNEVFGKIREAGVSYVVNPGVNLETSEGAVALAEQYPWIYAMVGCYPNETGSMDEHMLAVIEELAHNPHVVAIGEIGLDYHWKIVPHDVQQHWFREQIRLAERLELPIAIHDREAHGDVMNILKEEKAFEKTRVLMHCYSGSAEMAKEYLGLGCFFSISGTVTYGNNHKAKGILDVIPFDHMCVETDAPYLTPEPFRGQRNDPSLIVNTIAKIAELKEVPFDEVAAATCDTARRFYGIE